MSAERLRRFDADESSSAPNNSPSRRPSDPLLPSYADDIQAVQASLQHLDDANGADTTRDALHAWEKDEVADEQIAAFVDAMVPSVRSGRLKLNPAGEMRLEEVRREYAEDLQKIDAAMGRIDEAFEHIRAAATRQREATGWSNRIPKKKLLLMTRIARIMSAFTLKRIRKMTDEVRSNRDAWLASKEELENIMVAEALRAHLTYELLATRTAPAPERYFTAD